MVKLYRYLDNNKPILGKLIDNGGVENVVSGEVVDISLLKETDEKVYFYKTIRGSGSRENTYCIREIPNNVFNSYIGALDLNVDGKYYFDISSEDGVVFCDSKGLKRIG